MSDAADALALAGARLRAAREHVSAATLDASNAARDAHAAGMSEVAIARALDVTRNTVRMWLGKPRKR